MGLTNHSITDNATLSLEPQEEGIRVTVREQSDDGERVVYSAIHSRDFFDSTQKRNTIANEIHDNASVEPGEVKTAFKHFCHKLSGNDLSQDRKEMFRTEIVEQLLAETQSVDVYASENTTIEISLIKDGSERVIEFTPAEWTSSAPGKLAERYFNTFLERIEVTDEEWSDLVEEWDEMKEVASRETTTTWDAIVDRVVMKLKKRHTPHADREAFKNDEKTTLYQPNNGEPTLWVRSSFMTDLIEDAGKQPEEISQLSKELKKRGLTRGATRKKSGIRAYPFDAEELGISENEVHTNDDDDGPEVEP